MSRFVGAALAYAIVAVVVVFLVLLVAWLGIGLLAIVLDSWDAL